MSRAAEAEEAEVAALDRVLTRTVLTADEQLEPVSCDAGNLETHCLSSVSCTPGPCQACTLHVGLTWADVRAMDLCDIVCTHAASLLSTTTACAASTCVHTPPTVADQTAASAGGQAGHATAQYAEQSIGTP
jgi:hypothetical protein